VWKRVALLSWVNFPLIDRLYMTVAFCTTVFVNTHWFVFLTSIQFFSYSNIYFLMESVEKNISECIESICRTNHCCFSMISFIWLVCQSFFFLYCWDLIHHLKLNLFSFNLLRHHSFYYICSDMIWSNISSFSPTSYLISKS
jgi:hypothetical protein